MAVIDRKKFWQCVNIDWKFIGLVNYLVIGSLKPLLNIIGGGLLRRPLLCTVFLFVTKQCWPMVKFKSLYFVNIESLDDDSNWERMNWL